MIFGMGLWEGPGPKVGFGVNGASGLYGLQSDSGMFSSLCAGSGGPGNPACACCERIHQFILAQSTGVSEA